MTFGNGNQVNICMMNAIRKKYTVLIGQSSSIGIIDFCLEMAVWNGHYSNLSTGE